MDLPPVLGAVLALMVGGDGANAPAPLIPPGREGQVSRMLGSGAGDLPGHCIVSGIDIDRDHVRARYRCGGDNEVELELHPPGQVGPAVARTRHFSIVGSASACPPGFLAAVTALVRRHEEGWSWVLPPADGRSAPAGTRRLSPADHGPPPPDARDVEAAGIPLARRAPIAQALESGANDAAEALIAELAFDTPSPAALGLRGRALFAIGRYGEAVRTLENARAGLDDRGRFALALSYLMVDSADLARRELEALRAGAPANPLYTYWVARLDLTTGRHPEAVEGFRRILSMDARDAATYDGLGLAQEGLWRREEAMESYREAVRLGREAQTRDPSAAIHMGLLLKRLDRIPEAEASLREAVRDDPEGASARFELGLVLARGGRDAEALDELSKVVQLDPRSPRPYYVLAQLYRRAGRLDQARDAIRRFTELSENKPAP
jgi:tetratricopeptide (TPR) repeat protein